MQVQLEELQQRCRTLESAVTQNETEKRDLLEHLGKLIQAVDERDAQLKQQVRGCKRCRCVCVCACGHLMCRLPLQPTPQLKRTLPPLP